MSSHNHQYRTEHDSFGELQVPSTALYGAQTQRAINNFPISGMAMPHSFIRALGYIKASAAKSNCELGLLDSERAAAIQKAAEEIAAGQYSEHFPLDVFQTGSGTSTNMNCNEVIANLAQSYCHQTIHPNDHVNMSQSSNDVIPTAIHVSAHLAITQKLLPQLQHLQNTLATKQQQLMNITKTGRTHLMDAMPIRFDQEIGAWHEQIVLAAERIKATLPRLRQLAQGGTAVGTGINAHPDFSKHFITNIQNYCNIPFQRAANLCAFMSSQDTAVELSGQLRTLAVALMKISNDLRWMNSGPLAGIGEIQLPALQPGSSIMPGKVNPVIPEAVMMVGAQIIGNDATITVAGHSGNFQLNVMLPVIAYNLLQSIELLTNSCTILADKAIAGFTVNTAQIQKKLALNPILITALNNVIGYELGAKIAKTAYAEQRPIIDVAAEMTKLDRQQLTNLLDPLHLTHGGLPQDTAV